MFHGYTCQPPDSQQLGDDIQTLKDSKERYLLGQNTTGEFSA